MAVTTPANGATSRVGVITGRPHLRKDLRYDVGSFDYVCQVSITPTVILVSANSPYRTLAELFEYARKSPDRITYGHPGPGSIPHLQMIDLSSRAGVSLTSVPFRGDAPARNALMGNHIDVHMAADAGDRTNLRALAIVARDRVPALPDVPTTYELGFGEGFPTPFGVIAPKGLAPASLARLREACAASVKSEAFADVLTRTGQTAFYLDGPQFAARMQEVSAIIAALVDRLPSLRE